MKGMKSLMFIFAIVFFFSGKGEGKERADGDYLNKIRPERLVTPSEPFAKPYAGGKLKVFFLVSRNMAGREVVELFQRFDTEIDAVTAANSLLFVGSPYWESGIKGTLFSEKTAELKEKLSQEWNVIVIGNFNIQALPAECQYYIFKKVSEGTGLVIYHQVQIGKHIPEKVLSKVLDSEPKEIFCGIPFANLPGYMERWKQVKTPSELPKFMTKTYSFGKGRIITLSSYMITPGYYGGHSLTPEFLYSLEEEIRYDYYFSLISKAILWASPVKKPTITLQQDNFEAVTFKQEQLPAKLDGFYVTVDKPTKVILKQKVKNLFGDVTELQDTETTLNSGKNSLPLTLPELPVGAHFLDFQLVSKKGVEQWGSAAVKIEPSSLTISKIELSQPSYEKTDKVKATVFLTEPAISDIRLEVKVFDVPYNRALAVLDIPVAQGDEKTEISFPLDRAVAIAHFLRVDLISKQDILDIKKERFFVRKYEPVDKFPQVIWGTGIETRVGMIMAKQIRDAGFNTVLKLDGDVNLFLPMADHLYFPYSTHIRAPGPIYQDPKKTDETYTNPEFMNKTIQRILDKNALKLYFDAGLRPYYYSLGNECSYVNHWQYGPTDLAYYREYVKKQYKGDIKLLNNEWKTNYTSFNEIEPININKPITKEQLPIKYMQVSFAEHIYSKAHHDMAKGIKQFDPKAKVGSEGSKLGNLEEVLSELEFSGHYSYRFPNLLMISVGSKLSLMGNWWMGPLDPSDRYLGWMFSGCVNSNFYYCSQGSEGLMSADMSYTDLFEEKQLPVMREVASGLGQLISEAEMKKVGVGVHYSLVSEHADMIESGFGTARSDWETLLKLFDKYAVPFLFYTPKQIKEGKLQKDNVKILFLPMSQSIGKEEANALENWVKEGGTLIADVNIGTRNERCAVLEKGSLDELFGISRIGPPKPKTAGITGLKIKEGISFECEATIIDESVITILGDEGMKIQNTPVFIRRNAGKGKTLFLNFNLDRALTSSLSKEMRSSFIKTLLTDAGVVLEVTPPESFTVYQFKKGDMEFITSVRDPDEKQAKDVFISLSKPFWVYDTREGKPLGYISQIPLKVGDEPNRMFALLPEPAGKISITISQKIKSGDLIKVNAGISEEKNNAAGRLLRLSVFDPDDKEIMVLRRFAVLNSPSVDFAIPLAFNDPVGSYGFIVTDIATGITEKIMVEVKEK